MIDMIISQFNTRILNACEKYSKEFGCKRDQVYIRFGLVVEENNADMRLSLCKDGKIVREESMAKVMGVKHVGSVPIPLGTEPIILGAAPSFIVNTLITLSNEREIDPANICVYAYILDDGRLRLMLYDNLTYVCEMSLHKLVSGAEKEDVT